MTFCHKTKRRLFRYFFLALVAYQYKRHLALPYLLPLFSTRPDEPDIPEVRLQKSPQTAQNPSFKKYKYIYETLLDDSLITYLDPEMQIIMIGLLRSLHGITNTDPRLEI